MHSYAIFTSKKGRPKAQYNTHNPQHAECGQKKSSDADVLLSLFYLKKITEEQNEAARFYQKLCRDYYKSIECPVSISASLVRVENSACRVRTHPTARDQELFTQWLELKSELAKVDPSCEDVVYKVTIENRLKYELLNPTNVTRNLLRILQNGLDKIVEYCRRRNIR